jgi:hypothetical protein
MSDSPVEHENLNLLVKEKLLRGGKGLRYTVVIVKILELSMEHFCNQFDDFNSRASLDRSSYVLPQVSKWLMQSF